MEKRRLELERKQQKLQRMQQDRELMKIKAPMSGLVYFGDHKQGKWADSSQMAAILRVGAAAKLNQPLLTIVRNDELHLQGKVPEKHLAVVKVGASGTGKPTAFEDLEVKVTVDEVSLVPVSDGQFMVEASFAALPDAITITPGMTCQVVFDVASETEGE